MDINNPFREESKAYEFFEIANVDEEGYSDWVDLANLEKHGLGFGNGGGWARDDSKLGQTFNIVKERANPDKPSSKILKIRLEGFQYQPNLRNPLHRH